MGWSHQGNSEGITDEDIYTTRLLYFEAPSAYAVAPYSFQCNQTASTQAERKPA
jgi:hypothetical protein